MSVLACDREDCENIMCDRLILEGHAYICDECFAELVAFRKTWPEEMTKRDVEDKMWQFMRTPKNSHIRLEGSEIEDEFQRLTNHGRQRWEEEDE